MFSKKDGLAFTSYFQQTSALYFPFTIFNRQQTPNKTKQDRTYRSYKTYRKIFITLLSQLFIFCIFSLSFPLPCRRTDSHTHKYYTKSNK